MGEWLITDKVLLTNIRDTEQQLPPGTFYCNLFIQLVNGYLMQFITAGNHFFFYLCGIVLLFRLKTITRILMDLKVAKVPAGVTAGVWRKCVLIECHTIHVEVLQ